MTASASITFKQSAAARRLKTNIVQTLHFRSFHKHGQAADRRHHEITSVRHGAEIGTSAPARAAGHFSAEGKDIRHIGTSPQVGLTYLRELPMSHEIQAKKLWKPLQKIGANLKAVFARALHEDLRGLRKPASIITEILGCHENTARNYLAGVTEPSATHAAKLAQDGRFQTFRSILAAAITPSDTSLAEDLEQLKALQARVEARLREELSYVRPDPEMAPALSHQTGGGTFRSGRRGNRARAISPGPGPADRGASRRSER